LPDIILEAVRAVKIHNLFIQQIALEFNMNYRVLNRYCEKCPKYVTNLETCDNQSRV